MANRRITDLTALTAPATGDVLPIVDISEAAAADKNKKITYGELLASAPAGSAAAPSFSFDGDPNTGIFNPAADTLAFAEGGVEAMRIDSSGRLGIGTTGPNYTLDISAPQGNINVTSSTGTNNAFLRVNNTGGTGYIGLDSSAGGLGAPYSFNIWHSGNYPIVFATNNTERARIDSSGRLLVGTSSTSEVARAVFTGNSAAPTGNSYILLARGSNTGITSDNLGNIGFSDSGHVAAAYIGAFADGGTWTSGSSQPSRLVFSTTADGAASPTERLRITSAGVLQVADAGNITVGTTTGTKIGTATTQKLGFYNSTPVVQPAAVANATTAVDVITQLNDLLAKLRTLGIIAT